MASGGRRGPRPDRPVRVRRVRVEGERLARPPRPEGGRLVRPAVLLRGDRGRRRRGGPRHDHGPGPHAWLGPDQVAVMVEAARDELKKADPAHAANYDRRAAKYVGKLRKLKDDGLKMLADKKNRVIVTQHESLGYFAG